MEFVTVRDLRGQPGRVWQLLAEEKELVVTSNGRPIAVLSSVEGADLEQTLGAVRRARAVQAVTTMQERSAKAFRKGLPPAEVNAEIRAVRRSQRSRKR